MQVRFLPGLPDRKGREFLGLSFLKSCSNPFITRITSFSRAVRHQVVIIFPIKVIPADYSEKWVANKAELQQLAEQCIEGGADSDIECIDFVYPVKVAVYNTNNQVSKILLAANDKDLHNFIRTLKANELASFIFPIIMQLPDGSKIDTRNNTELVDAINLYKNSCDEDDDFDFKDDDIDDSDLILALTNGSWKVYNFLDVTNQTSLFSSMTFVFNPDGTATIMNGTTTVNGTWATYGEDGKLELELDFGDASPFNKLSEDWDVIAFDTTTISLKSEPDPGESMKTLIFKRP